MDPETDRREVPRPGEAVGLGRVVDNPAGLGQAGRGMNPNGEAAATEVEVASAESFPASDPPGFMTEPATPADAGRIEPPEPRDEP